MDVQEVMDRALISELISRYFAAIDDKQFTEATMEPIFGTQGRVRRPNGTESQGWERIVQDNRTSFSRFSRTHHTTTDHIVEFIQGGATVRANITAMHLWAPGEGDGTSIEGYFLAGSVLLAKVAWTRTGWRLLELEVYNTWRQGSGLASMARSGK